MPKYAILNEDLTIREIRFYDEAPAHKPGRLLPVNEDPIPEYDPLTQYVSPGTPIVGPIAVDIPWVVNSLPKEVQWENVQNAGWTDSVTGIKLKMTKDARDYFVGQVTLTNLALARGAIEETDTQSIWDYDNQEHIMTTAEFLSLILRYGFYYQQSFNTYAP